MPIRPASPHLALALALALAIAFAPGCRRQKKAESEQESAPPRWTLAGQVVVPRGVAAEGVLVFAQGTPYLAMTDEEGHWFLAEVPPGSYQLRAQREDLLPGDLGRVTLPSTMPKDPEDRRHKVTPITLSLRPRKTETTSETSFGAVRGVVHLAGGSTDYEGVVVEVAGTEFRTATNSLGEYFFPALPPGASTLVFTRRGWKSVEAKAEVRAGVEMAGPIVDLLPEDLAQVAHRQIRGIVELKGLEEDATPDFSKIIVALQGTSHVTIPDAQGKFLFKDLEPAPYAIIASAAGFLLKENVPVNLTDVEATEVKLTLERDPEASKKFGSFTGVVTYDTPPAENDHSGIIVSLPGMDLVAVTDAEGNYQIENVPPGVYILRAQADGYNPAQIEGVEAKAGESAALDPLQLTVYIEPPQVVYTDPADGTRNVAIQKNTAVSVRFSKPMRPGTVKTAFSILPAVSAKLFMGREHPQADFDLLYVELQGAPSSAGGQPLSYATTYRVTIGEDATDYDNAHLVEPYSFEFTTGEAQIIASRPAEGERNANVFPDQPIVLYMNAAMDRESISAEDIRIRPAPSSSVRIQIFDDQDSGWTELRIYANLQSGESYTLDAGGNWRTLDRSRLSNLPYRLRFRTVEMKPMQSYSGKKD